MSTPFVKSYLSGLRGKPVTKTASPVEIYRASLQKAAGLVEAGSPFETSPGPQVLPPMKLTPTPAPAPVAPAPAILPAAPAPAAVPNKIASFVRSYRQGLRKTASLRPSFVEIYRDGLNKTAASAFEGSQGDLALRGLGSSVMSGLKSVGNGIGNAASAVGNGAKAVGGAIAKAPGQIAGGIGDMTKGTDFVGSPLSNSIAKFAPPAKGPVSSPAAVASHFPPAGPNGAPAPTPFPRGAATIQGQLTPPKSPLTPPVPAPATKSLTERATPAANGAGGAAGIAAAIPKPAPVASATPSPSPSPIPSANPTDATSPETTNGLAGTGPAAPLAAGLNPEFASQVPPLSTTDTAPMASMPPEVPALGVNSAPLASMPPAPAAPAPTPAPAPAVPGINPEFASQVPPLGGIDTAPLASMPADAPAGPLGIDTAPLASMPPAPAASPSPSDAFRKAHGTAFDPNSPEDRWKMQQLQNGNALVGRKDYRQSLRPGLLARR